MIKNIRKNIMIVMIIIILASFIVNSQSDTPIEEDLKEEKIEAIENNLIENNEPDLEPIPEPESLSEPEEIEETEEPIEVKETEIETTQEEDSILVNIEDINSEIKEEIETTQEEDSILVNIEDINSEIKEEIETTTNNTENPTTQQEDSHTNQSNQSSQSTEPIQPPKPPKDPLEEQTMDLDLSSRGKIAFEIKDAPLGVEINKEETINEKGNKEITISSTEHIETEITAYADIPEISEQEKDNVKIYWITENQEIPIKEFIDSDDNNLYDRISWVVPHLSEQIFEIIINFTTEASSPTIEIITNKAPTGEVNNPIEFEFFINYSNMSDVNCTISIDNESMINTINQKIENKTIIWEISSLENGTHNWFLFCKDNITLIENSTSGNFTVNENFSTLLSKEVYVLNGDGSLIGGAGELNINSAKSSDVNIKIQKASSLHYQTNVTTTSYALNLDNTIINQTGNYNIITTFNRLAEPISKGNTFSVAKMSISANTEEANTDEDISFSINIESPLNNVVWYEINFGDDTKTTITDNLQSPIQKTISHKYSSSGNFVITLTAQINGEPYSITKNGISIENSEDNQEPTIELLNPRNNEERNNERIIFEYKANDNIKIKNCTFELYNYSGNLGSLDYTKTNENLANNEKVQISLQNFDSMRYSWNVYCCDNSSNCNDDLEYYREFKINTNSISSESNDNIFDHERREEIDDLISKIDSFIQKKESYSLEEKEILEDLGISNELETDKKILIQINAFLGNDIKFIEDTTLREKTKKEREDQIEEIKNRIPLDMKILESSEYVKNSITKNMKEIIQDYAIAKNIKADKKALEVLSKLNYDLQNSIIVSTKVKQIEITYINSKKDLTLITKKLDIKNNTFDTLLEVIPKEIIDNASKATFLVESKVIKEDPIFEISVDDLNDEKIIYYIEGLIDVKKIQETDTLAFKEFAISNKITGFSVLDLGGGDLFYYLVFIIFIIIIGYLVYTYLKKRKIIEWKKEENVSRIFSSMKEANRSLEKRDIETAKEDYHKIQELYPLIPEGCKKYLNKKIKKIRIEVDKKEIFSLVKEYEQAKTEKRQEDAQILYKNIQSIYKRLPKKYQKRVYEKMFSYKI